MKQSVSTTTIFQLVLVVTFLFAAFLALTITYNRVYRLKNQVITILEKKQTLSPSTIELINDYLFNSGYNTTGKCDLDEIPITSLETGTPGLPGGRGNYCYSIKKIDSSNVEQYVYKVKLFFKFNLPFLGDLFTFNIKGETKGIKGTELERNLWNQIKEMIG